MSETPKDFHRPPASFARRRAVFLGKESDSIIKSFFGGSATVAIVILALITIFLFKEGAGFLGAYHKSLRVYRLSGLEYVDILKEKRADYTALTRYLNDIRADWINELRARGLSQSEISEAVGSDEARAFFLGYMRLGSDLRSFIKERMDAAIAIRDRHVTNENLEATLGNYVGQMERVADKDYRFDEQDRAQFRLSLEEFNRENTFRAERIAANRAIIGRIQAGEALGPADRDVFLDLLRREYEAIAADIRPVDFERAVQDVVGGREEYYAALDAMRAEIPELLRQGRAVDFDDPGIAARVDRFAELNRTFLESFPEHRERLAAWDPAEPISVWRALGAFLTGTEWITASDQQDWYGLVPLLTGSLLISAIALFFAIPLGVGAAIYVNQIAGPAERNLIKPYIEFVSAIPSVVIGFFGVVVFGEAIRAFSQIGFMQWVPFFPIQERLNAFTAGCLLALMAIPTIFTLAEDAINNIPRHFKEASLAVGATQLQTTFRVVVPTALSGIISAIMLGFGRVIGETMVVLLCAGNRIKIPDFGEGMGVFFEPVHTMTGIIAQEMGEVVRGSIHYRALFMVGIVLFFISLIINYSAQWVVKRYRKVGD